MSIKYALIDEAASGLNEVVAAKTGYKFVVLEYGLIAAGAVSVTWKTATTALSGAMPIAANGGISASSFVVVPGGVYGMFETAVSEALNLTLSAAVQVSGHLVYREVKI